MVRQGTVRGYPTFPPGHALANPWVRLGYMDEREMARESGNPIPSSDIS